MRFGLFHVLQAGARAEQRAIPAKGLTGTGYDGHAFWDTETFVLPVLTFTLPAAAADALRWRHSTLAAAQAHAAQLGLAGAAFPWRTIRGEECSGTGRPAPPPSTSTPTSPTPCCATSRPPATTSSSARSASTCSWRRRGCGAPSATTTRESKFRIDGVTGPDEYSAVADNNVYTNLMAQQNLRGAADVSVPPPARGRAPRGERGGDRELAGRGRARCSSPTTRGSASTRRPRASPTTRSWDFEHTPEDQYPLLLHYPYFDLYRKQVVKQADLVLAMVLCPEAFTPGAEGGATSPTTSG